MLRSQREGGGTGKGGMHASVKGEFQVQFLTATNQHQKMNNSKDEV